MTSTSLLSTAFALVVACSRPAPPTESAAASTSTTSPVPTTLVLRVINDGDAPVVLRTGGDDEGFEIDVKGAGLVSTKSTAPCPDGFAFGKKATIAPHGSLDVPLRTFASGPRCAQTAHYLTAPGLYDVRVSLRAHVHADAGPPDHGERGTEVRLTAPTITLRAG